MIQTVFARRFLQFVIVLAAFLLSSTPVRAEHSATDLLSLVPRDFGFCLAVNQLKEHYQQQKNTSWAKAIRRLKHSSRKFAALDRLDDLTTHLQLSWSDLRDDIFGRAVVLAYRPKQKGKSEQGLLMLSAPKPKLLAKLVDRIQNLQKQDGELLEVKKIKHGDQTYYVRRETKQTNCYYIRDDLFIFASDQQLMKELLDRLNASQQSDKQQWWADRARETLGKTTMVALAFNPRVVDEEIQHKAAKAKPSEKTVLGAFSRYWQAMKFAVLSLDLSSTIDLKLTLQGDPNRVPRSAQQLLKGLATPSDLWNRFPDDAILRIAARIDAQALVSTMAEFVPGPQRTQASRGVQKMFSAALGLDFTKEVLPNLGPDVGFCVLPNDTGLPFLVAAVAVAPGEQGVDKSLVQGLEFAARLAMLDHNSKHPTKPIRLKTEIADKVSIKYLDGPKFFPAGVRPSFALKDGYLVFASSPVAFAWFKNRESDMRKPPLVDLSIKNMVRMLKAQDDRIEAMFGSRSANGPAWVDKAIAALSLFDFVRLSQASRGDKITWTLRIQPSAHDSDSR